MSKSLTGFRSAHLIPCLRPILLSFEKFSFAEKVFAGIEKIHGSVERFGQGQGRKIAVEGSLIQKTIPAAPQSPSADFSPVVKNVVQYRALKTGCSGTAIFGACKPRTKARFYDRAEERPVNLVIDHSGLQAAKIMRGRHG